MSENKTFLEEKEELALFIIKKIKKFIFSINHILVHGYVDYN